MAGRSKIQMRVPPTPSLGVLLFYRFLGKCFAILCQAVVPPLLEGVALPVI